MRKATLPSPYRSLLHYGVIGPWLVTCLLAACGAGAAATEEAMQAQAEANAAGTQHVESTAPPQRPDQLRLKQVDLNLSSARAHLNGEVLVVKLHDEAGNTYYLGTAGTADELQLTLVLPPDLGSLRLEVFTEVSGEASYRDEITL